MSFMHVCVGLSCHMAVFTLKYLRKKAKKEKKWSAANMWHSWCTHGMHVASWSHSCNTCGQLVYMLRRPAGFWSRPAMLNTHGVEKKSQAQELQDACLEYLVLVAHDVFFAGSCMHIMPFSASVGAWWTHPRPKAGFLHRNSSCMYGTYGPNTCSNSFIHAWSLHVQTCRPKKKTKIQVPQKKEKTCNWNWAIAFQWSSRRIWASFLD